MNIASQSPFSDEHYKSIVAVSEMCRAILMLKYGVSESERKVVIDVFNRMAMMIEHCPVIEGNGK